MNHGQNILFIKGLKTDNDTIFKSVNINYDSVGKWPINYQVNWSEHQNIQDVVQVVHGNWYIDQNEYLRTKSGGYDRLIAIGDSTWLNYEITVPIFIHQFEDMRDLGSGPGVGILTGWQSSLGIDQPRNDVDFYSLAWYRRLVGKYH